MTRLNATNATPRRSARHLGRAACLAAIILSLGACVGFQDVADQLARQQARQFVNAEVQQRFPGVDATPITDCVIDHASAQEIVTIAGGVAFGETQAATNTVSTVLQRPATLQCASGNFLGGSTFDSLLRGLL